MASHRKRHSDDSDQGNLGLDLPGLEALPVSAPQSPPPATGGRGAGEGLTIGEGPTRNDSAGIETEMVIVGPPLREDSPWTSVAPDEPRPLTIAELLEALGPRTQQKATSPPPPALSPFERVLLRNCRQTVHFAAQHVLEAALALAVVQQKQLYREAHKSFAEYIREECDFAKAHAYRLLRYALVCQELAAPTGTEVGIPGEESPSGRLLLPNERQARDLALLKLPRDKKQQVWQCATESRQPVTRKTFNDAIAAVVGPESAEMLKSLTKPRLPRTPSFFVTIPGNLTGKIEKSAREESLTPEEFVLRAVREKLTRDPTLQRPRDLEHANGHCPQNVLPASPATSVPTP